MLPIKLGPCSNGEFVPQPPSPVVREAARRALADADRHARRLGMSRRQFLRSSMGAATTLLALAACSSEASRSEGGGEPGGTFSVPPDAATDTTAAGEALGPGDAEVVVDVQTHFLEHDELPRLESFFGRGFPQADCGDDARLCFTIDRWADLVLASSDTSVAVLSALPVVADDHPMSAAKMDEARRLADALCGDGRVLLQGEAFPTVGELGEALERMSGLRAEHDIVAWKTYTHTGRQWRFDDAVGEAFLAHIEAIGPPVVAVHKGFSGGDRFASPVDIGPAATAHPDLTFLVYHSGFEPGATEGPFDAGGPGVDRLVATLGEAGIGPGGNVYAELGSTWRTLMGRPAEAAHVIGKLLLAVGEDRILWGTDSVWYGSPQDQIEAFRTFEISAELQERFGYPALTPEIKRKVLGANAAALHALDLAALEPCRFTPEEREAARQEVAFAGRTLGPVAAADVRATFARGHPWFR